MTLTKGFYLGVHPVTQAQWQAVMGGNPSHFKGDNRPVENVSWEDCQEFCRKLGERDGQAVSFAHGGGVGIRLPCGHDDRLLQRQRPGSLAQGRLVQL